MLPEEHNTPVEFLGKAGDTLIWDSFLFHSGSVNVNPTPRFGIVARFSHRRTEDPVYRYEVPEDLWKYWAI